MGHRGNRSPLAQGRGSPTHPASTGASGGSLPTVGPRDSLRDRREVNCWVRKDRGRPWRVPAGLRTPGEPGAAVQWPCPSRSPHQVPAGAEDSSPEPSGLLPPSLARPLESEGLRPEERTANPPPGSSLQEPGRPRLTFLTVLPGPSAHKHKLPPCFSPRQAPKPGGRQEKPEAFR